MAVVPIAVAPRRRRGGRRRGWSTRRRDRRLAAVALVATVSLVIGVSSHGEPEAPVPRYDVPVTGFVTAGAREVVTTPRLRREMSREVRAMRTDGRRQLRRQLERAGVLDAR